MTPGRTREHCPSAQRPEAALYAPAQILYLEIQLSPSDWRRSGPMHSARLLGLQCQMGAKRADPGATGTVIIQLYPSRLYPQWI